MTPIFCCRIKLSKLFKMRFTPLAKLQRIAMQMMSTIAALLSRNTWGILKVRLISGQTHKTGK